MKKFLLFLLFYFVINQFQIHFTDGMDRGKSLKNFSEFHCNCGKDAKSYKNPFQ